MHDGEHISGATEPIRRRVLILSAGIGAGHNVVATTISEAISDRWPEVDVQTTDVLNLAPALYRSVTRGFPVQMMTRAPRLYGFLYRAGDLRKSPRPGFGEQLRNLLLQPVLRRIQRLIHDCRPDIILHTHFLGLPPADLIRRRHQLPFKHAVVVTDVVAHRFWYWPKVDRWFVAAAESVAALRAWGISDLSITVGGIPVAPHWETQFSAQNIRKRWNLPGGRPVILLSGGAFCTVGPVPTLAQRLQAACPGAVVVVLCGTNTALREQLQQFSGAGETLFTIPFSDRVHELVSLATVFVTKPGGVTTAECIAAGTPMVLMPPVPGQEAGNAAWLAQHRAAIVGQNVADVVSHVQRLLEQPPELESLSRSARALFRPGRDSVMAWVQESLGLP